MHQFMNVDALEKEKINIAWYDVHVTFKNNLKDLKNNSTAAMNFIHYIQSVPMPFPFKTLSSSSY